MVIKDGVFNSYSSGKEAIEATRQLLHEREKTKRILIGAACFFIVVAAIICVYAPAGKEKMSYIMGAALLIMALGAIGATQFKIKIPFVEVQANYPDHDATTVAPGPDQTMQ